MGQIMHIFNSAHSWNTKLNANYQAWMQDFMSEGAHIF